jgi:uncharacterized repeat protein (TIGR03803 family)
MNTHIRNLFLLPVLLTGVGFMLAGPVTAQTFTTLYSFSAFDPGSPNVNNDGATPFGDLVISSNTLYGTTLYGGSSGVGVVFAVNTDGTGFSALYSFSGGSGGKWPGNAGLVLSGSTLFGTTSGGGNGIGNLFAINTDGSGFTDLYDFSIESWNAYSFETNSDGSGPNYLVLSGSTLYGTAFGGGIFGNGTVFTINTDGSGFTTLHNFGPPGVASPPNNKNTEGAYPSFGVIISGNTLYGTTTGGGNGGYGTVFKVNIDGTGFTTLYSGSALYQTISLVLSGTTLYWRNGDVYAVNTDGSGFTTIYTGDTVWQTVSLILSGNTLYGAATQGGTAGHGTVFSFVLPPQLTLTPSGGNVVLTWPTNATGFTLQSTTNVGSSAVWTTNTPAPVIVNDQNVVTNSISGAQQFFRLSQ